MLIHRAGAKHLYIPGGSLGVRACSAGEIGGTGGVTSTYSVSFDGSDDRIDCGAAGDLQVFTMCAWFKTTNTTNYQFIGTTGSFGSPTIAGYGLTYYSPGPNLQFDHTSIATVLQYSVNLHDGTWHHVGIYRASNNAVGIFIDGNFVATGTYAATFTNGNFNIGGRPGGGQFFPFTNGLIDDVRIYNVALSPTDVANLYAGQDVTTGLVAYWPLEEGSGTNTVDTVGGNNGTLTNGPTWSTDVPAALA